ncbi:ABC transporter ATP-binding protein [Bariatricus sp. SGI.154]|uniref:ABC transporter ATP-binding protein n=1 Tax=Bariatricus sp. SGI.154 TaxID=3420549 RepID=UPI003D03810E
MWKYVKKYFHYAILAALFMIFEVSMDLIQPEYMSRIVDKGVLGLHHNGIGDIHLILTLGLVMIGLVILGGLCGSLNNMFVHMTGQNIGNEMRKDCFRRIMAMSFPQIDRFGTGSLVTRVTNDITQVQNLVSQFVRGMIRTFMLMAGSIFFMFRLNHQFGLIVLCAFPFILGCMIFCLWKAEPLFTQLQAQLDQINGILQEDISGIRIIKACVRELYEKMRFKKSNDNLTKTQLHILIIFVFMNPVMNALMYIVVVIILLSGSVQVKTGMATPGTIMAAITYTTQLLRGILMLVMLFQNISRGTASWKRIKEVLHSQPELKAGDFKGDTLPQGQIEFRNVSFAFPGTDQLVLKSINLTVAPGETIAIMGATGSGKTALISLIPRFYDVTEGSILIDGVDVRNYCQRGLRDKIAVILQKSELFSTSIKNNLIWGKPDATLEEIRSAADIAQADEFIRTTTNGYDTLVAERGMNFSGGQKQRLSIARAMLKPAEILIFDDSTSALDLKTESSLYTALNKARPDSTKIIVAQRIASVRNADRIIVLDRGTIAACGTHNELMHSCKTYQDIYHSQIGGEDHE